MTNFKATPEQWAQCEEWVKNPVVGASDACILELRARVEALEANHPEKPDSSDPAGSLVQQWAAFVEKYGIADVFTTAARWGADQELEACCKAICNSATEFSAAALLEVQRRSDNLRAARRPKPPSLKEQGLVALKLLKQRTTDPNIIEPLTRALEALPND